MLNNFKLFIASIVVVNLISSPAQSQTECPYLNYMIGPNNNCINLDALGGQKARTSSNQTPEMVDNNEKMESSTEVPEESEKSFEQLELEYSIEQKQNSIALIQEQNEQMQEQIEVSCAKLSNLDRRQFCLQQKERLGKQIEENQERITSLETEIKELEKQVENLANN